MHCSLTCVTVLLLTTNHINNKFSWFQVSGIQECVTVHTGKDFNALVLVDVMVNNYCDIPGHSICKVFACRTVLFACKPKCDVKLHWLETLMRWENKWSASSLLDG